MGVSAHSLGRAAAQGPPTRRSSFGPPRLDHTPTFFLENMEKWADMIRIREPVTKPVTKGVVTKSNNVTPVTKLEAAPSHVVARLMADLEAQIEADRRVGRPRKWESGAARQAAYRARRRGE